MSLSKLPLDIIDVIFNTLPIEITIIDENNKILYYNQPKEKLFPRTVELIGQKIDLCHSEKSILLINKIISLLQNGERDVHEYGWRLENRYIHTQIVAIRDKKGKYLGTMLINQDVTKIQRTSGSSLVSIWNYVDTSRYR